MPLSACSTHWSFQSCRPCSKTACKCVQMPLVHMLHLELMAFAKLVFFLVNLDSLSSCALHLEQASGSDGAQHTACKA